MTKSEMIAAIAEGASTSKADAGRMLDTLTSLVAAELNNGNEVTIHGLGKLKPVARAARTGRNPKTGTEIQIAAKTGVKFSAAKALTDYIQ